MEDHKPLQCLRFFHHPQTSFYLLVVDTNPFAKTHPRQRSLIFIFQQSIKNPFRILTEDDICVLNLSTNSLPHNCLLPAVLVRLPTTVIQTFIVTMNYCFSVYPQNIKILQIVNQRYNIAKICNQHICLIQAHGKKYVQTEIYTYVSCLFNLERFDIIYTIFHLIDACFSPILPIMASFSHVNL